MDVWCEDEPETGTPFTIRGIHSIRWAWEARGSGWGNTVSEEAARVFLERLDMAAQDLATAARRDAEDPTPLANLLIAQRGLGVGAAVARRTFEGALARHPENRTAHEHMLQFLTEKWCGSHDEMFTFARGVAAEADEGSALFFLIPAAHIERALLAVREKEVPGLAEYFAGDLVQQEIQAAYERSVGHPAYVRNKLSFMDYNVFAFVLAMMDHADAARYCFEQVGERSTEAPWGYLSADHVHAFEKVRKVYLET